MKPFKQKIKRSASYSRERWIYNGHYMCPIRISTVLTLSFSQMWSLSVFLRQILKSVVVRIFIYRSQLLARSWRMSNYYYNYKTFLFKTPQLSFVNGAQVPFPKLSRRNSIIATTNTALQICCKCPEMTLTSEYNSTVIKFVTSTQNNARGVFHTLELRSGLGINYQFKIVFRKYWSAWIQWEGD